MVPKRISVGIQPFALDVALQLPEAFNQPVIRPGAGGRNQSFSGLRSVSGAKVEAGFLRSKGRHQTRRGAATQYIGWATVLRSTSDDNGFSSSVPSDWLIKSLFREGSG